MKIVPSTNKTFIVQPLLSYKVHPTKWTK